MMLCDSFTKIQSLTNIKPKESSIIFSPSANDVDVYSWSIIREVGLELGEPLYHSQYSCVKSSASKGLTVNIITPVFTSLEKAIKLRCKGAHHKFSYEYGA